MPNKKRRKAEKTIDIKVFKKERKQKIRTLDGAKFSIFFIIIILGYFLFVLF